MWFLKDLLHTYPFKQYVQINVALVRVAFFLVGTAGFLKFWTLESGLAGSCKSENVTF